MALMARRLKKQVEASNILRENQNLPLDEQIAAYHAAVEKLLSVKDSGRYLNRLITDANNVLENISVLDRSGFDERSAKLEAIKPYRRSAKLKSNLAENKAEFGISAKEIRIRVGYVFDKYNRELVKSLYQRASDCQDHTPPAIRGLEGRKLDSILNAYDAKISKISRNGEKEHVLGVSREKDRAPPYQLAGAALAIRRGIDISRSALAFEVTDERGRINVHDNAFLQVMKEETDQLIKSVREKGKHLRIRPQESLVSSNPSEHPQAGPSRLAAAISPPEEAATQLVAAPLPNTRKRKRDDGENSIEPDKREDVQPTSSPRPYEPNPLSPTANRSADISIDQNPRRSKRLEGRKPQHSVSR